MLNIAYNDLNLSVLLLTLCVSAAVCCLALYAMLRNRFTGAYYGYFIRVLFGAALSLLCVDYLCQFDARFVGTTKVLLQIVCVASLSLAIWLIGSIGTQWRRMQNCRRNWGVWTICFGAFALCILCANRMQAALKEDITLHTSPELPGAVKPISSHVGYTDRGRKINLYCFELKGALPARASEITATANSYPAALISRKGIDFSANCHGWVFANGAHLVNSEGVEMILEDNGYIRTDRPKAGDIAIYRNINGNILHTALVCSVLQDDTVLVESKWGVHQRFIHLPENQPYSTLFEYYSTERPSHTIAIEEVNLTDGYPLDSKMGG